MSYPREDIPWVSHSPTSPFDLGTALHVQSLLVRLDLDDPSYDTTTSASSSSFTGWAMPHWGAKTPNGSQENGSLSNGAVAGIAVSGPLWH